MFCISIDLINGIIVQHRWTWKEVQWYSVSGQKNIRIPHRDYTSTPAWPLTHSISFHQRVQLIILIASLMI